ncbi:MAG: Lrp/AsnC ligand binding domain-containing protein [Candidatus Scalinduaceae bacterium]
MALAEGNRILELNETNNLSFVFATYIDNLINFKKELCKHIQKSKTTFKMQDHIQLFGAFKNLFIISSKRVSGINSFLQFCQDQNVTTSTKCVLEVVKPPADTQVKENENNVHDLKLFKAEQYFQGTTIMTNYHLRNRGLHFITLQKESQVEVLENELGKKFINLSRKTEIPRMLCLPELDKTLHDKKELYLENDLINRYSVKLSRRGWLKFLFFFKAKAGKKKALESVLCEEILGVSQYKFARILYHMTGEYDFMIPLDCADMQHLRKVIRDFWQYKQEISIKFEHNLIIPDEIKPKVSYYRERQLLACKGNMSEYERGRLIGLNQSSLSIRAISELFNQSQKSLGTTDLLENSMLSITEPYPDETVSTEEGLLKMIDLYIIRALLINATYFEEFETKLKNKLLPELEKHQITKKPFYERERYSPRDDFLFHSISREKEISQGHVKNYIEDYNNLKEKGIFPNIEFNDDVLINTLHRIECENPDHRNEIAKYISKEIENFDLISNIYLPIRSPSILLCILRTLNNKKLKKFITDLYGQGCKRIEYNIILRQNYYSEKLYGSIRCKPCFYFADSLGKSPGRIKCGNCIRYLAPRYKGSALQIEDATL